MFDFLDSLYAGAGIFGIALIAACFIYMVLSCKRIVPTNMVHIVRRGNKTGYFGTILLEEDKPNVNNNIYYEFPSWIPFIGVTVSKLSTAVFSLELSDYEAYDKDKTPFKIDIVAFFRIGNPLMAAVRITSMDELKTQLKAILQGAARTILAKDDIEKIMCSRNVYGDLFTKEVEPQLREWGINVVKNIELMDIHDSKDTKVIFNIMQKKQSIIEMDSRKVVAENKKIAENAEIIARKEVELQQEEKRQSVGLRKAEVDQKVGVAQEEAKQLIKEQAKLTAEKEMEVLKVNNVKAAEIEKEQEIVKAEAEKRRIELQAEAEKSRIELQAEADRKKVEQEAEAQLKAAQNRAIGTEANGKAEALAKELMQNALIAGDITLSKEIGGNHEYQDFVIRQKQVEALCVVGKEQAKNLAGADIKIFANANDVTSGVNKATNVFSSQTGMNFNALMETLEASGISKDILQGFLTKLNGNPAKVEQTVTEPVTK